MRAAYHLLLLAVQAGITFVALLSSYLLLALLDYRGGFPAFIGLVTFQPVLGAILSLATISICVVVGLPLRLTALGSWWRQRGYLALGGALAGGGVLGFFLLSAGATEAAGTGGPSALVVAGSGWFLLAFSLLHVFPPDTWLHRLSLLRPLYSK
jgi:hypothetical protein